MIHIEKAYAKINLFLDVLNKRDDGYHNIGTLFQTISACDLLSFQENPVNKIELTYTIKPNYPVESDLIYKSALLLQEKHKINKGVKIHLDKNLPSGAGLGGGSADAAATLRALNKIWGLGLSLKELECIGGQLGADIPFLIQGGTALASGIGDELTTLRPLKLPENHVVLLITPQCEVETAAAYGSIGPSGAERWQNYLQSLQEINSDRSCLNLLFYNKFEESVFKIYPEIAEMKKIMLKMGAQQALMSGSGSSLFGIYESEDFAKEVIEQLQDRIRWSFVGKFI
ncbi:MAG: 4-(cytidine 5'-diphospho)-2-C-methyl-D-erythritol kinase [Fibrobacter sp.]|nr:4-(cytidine 5'-diphospho)-2-C-methyl-D-erythritol kinase [Fibrobacter sp.]